MPRSIDIEKLQAKARERHIVPDFMLPSKEFKISSLEKTINEKLIFIDAQVGDRINKTKVIEQEENPFKRKKTEDRNDVALGVLQKRTDHSERSEKFYEKRPPARYSNTTPYGIAQEMLWEQLNEENSFRFMKKRKI